MTPSERAQAIYRTCRALEWTASCLAANVRPGHPEYISKAAASRAINHNIQTLYRLACDRCHGLETIPEPDDSSPNVRGRCPDCAG